MKSGEKLRGAKAGKQLNTSLKSCEYKLIKSYGRKAALKGKKIN